MYDTDKITAKKTFIEFDLEKISALGDAEEKRGALALFAFFFGKGTYAPRRRQASPAPSSKPLPHRPTSRWRSRKT